MGCETLQTEKALERFNFEKAETQSNGECRPKRATHKGRPSPSRNGLFTRLETGASFPHEREEKSSPVRRFSASAAARPHLCRWPSAPRCLIRLTPSASAADAAMARARRRSRTPAGRTERRSRRGHHPGHRPGKVRADAPCGTRRTGDGPTQETNFAFPHKGEYGGAGGVEGEPLSPHAPRRAGDPPPAPGSSRDAQRDTGLIRPRRFTFFNVETLQGKIRRTYSGSSFHHEAAPVFLCPFPLAQLWARLAARQNFHKNFFNKIKLFLVWYAP